MSYKILSLDGGGSWALIQARVLMDLYDDKPGHEILKEFDMAIANSGGSMVLAALCSNLRPSQIVQVFENAADRKEVFSKLKFWEAPMWGILKLFTKKFGPRYSTERKKTGLQKVLRRYTGYDRLLVDLPMSEIPKRIPNCPELIICGYNYYSERATFFRSNLDSKTAAFGSARYDVSMLDAIHASSNAPLNYFNKSALINTGLTAGSKAWYWDGAVGGFNNPVMAGVIEAITNGKGRTAEDFGILSLGTDTGRRPVMVSGDEDDYAANKGNDLVVTERYWGFRKDLTKMAQSILADPPDAASFMAYSVLDPELKPGANIIRINPCISPVKDKTTNIYKVPEAWGGDRNSYIRLLDLDMDAVEDEDVKLITRLCDLFITDAKPCIPNQFIRGDKDGRHLGEGSYREAKGKWLSSVN